MGKNRKSWATRLAGSTRPRTKLPSSLPQTPVVERTRDTDSTATAGVEGDDHDSGPSDTSHASIAGLLGIPLEIFTQVASNLGPGDLLALARTCKSLRAFLMSKAQTATWQNAEQNTPRLPPCPTTMSQPQYAALAFMNECSFCGESTNVKLEPKLRVRLCESCRASELVDVFSVKEHERLYLIQHLSFTLRGPAPPSKDTKGGAVPKVSSNRAHCLRRDLQNFCATREMFLESGDKDELHLWELKIRSQVGIHDQFAEILRRFLIHPELTPMQKAWKRAGERVDRTPDPEDSTVFNNYDTDVEEQDPDEEYEDPREEDYDRCNNFHIELQRAKPFAHPFVAVLEILGVETDPLLATLGLDSPITPGGIKDYPFPTTATVLSWPCFSTFHELRPSQIADCFLDELGHIIHHVEAWRANGERELVEWWKSGTAPTGDLTNPTVKVRASTAATASLSSNLRLLLRADTVFSHEAPGTPGGQGAHLHYPHFYRNPNDCPCHGFPRGMNSTRMYRHLEAERVTKALLRGLGIPDVAYIQLLLMGSSLVCGRCHDNKPRTWDEMVDHYRQEAQLWTELRKRAPEFKTKRPLEFVNVHDLNSASSPKPFIRRLTKNEVANLTSLPPLGADKGFCCILCRNYQVCHVFKNLGQIWTHMNDVHGITNPVLGLHYNSRASSTSFSRWGEKWCDSWDAHQAAREWDS